VREADQRETAVDGYRSLLFLDDELSRRRSPATPTDQRRVPPPPARADAAFVELGGEAEPLIETLGFVRAGEHRTKPVTWWRNGDAHVVLNHTTSSSRPIAFGLESNPVTDIEARAAALRWPGVAKQRSTGEARLPGLSSPSGIHLFVSASPGSADFWQQDFDPIGTKASGVSTWSGLDHIGSVVDEQHLNSETSFYRTMLGMLPGPVTEFMEPHGRMRSSVLRPPAGDLRIVVNAGTDDIAPGINQIAFACTDVRAEVCRMRSAGVELLEPSENYYDDLDARFGLDPDTLAVLRDHNLFYDRVDDGELLHAYTPVLNGQFYVEILERRRGYEGYGAANTTVRLTLQTGVSSPRLARKRASEDLRRPGA
jgi:4-hydroxyphenylpyruvate dioxygenase